MLSKQLIGPVLAVFQKFYYRPQYPIKIGVVVVLAASASNSHVVMKTFRSVIFKWLRSSYMFGFVR